MKSPPSHPTLERIFFLAPSPRYPGLDFWTQGANEAGIPSERGFLSGPLDLLRQWKTLSGNPVGTLVHALGPVCSHLAASFLPKTMPLVVSEVRSREFAWNRSLRNRIDASLLRPNSLPAPNPLKDGEYELWFFGPWTSLSGAQQLLWAFTMIAMAGWRIRLRLLGQGDWEDTLRQFARMASFGDQIEFLPCDPVILKQLPHPDLIFSPDPEAIPSWLQPALEGVKRVVSRPESKVSAPISDGQVGEDRVGIAWQPTELARITMELLGPRARPQASLQRKGIDLPPWTVGDCYRKAWLASQARRR